MRSVKYFRHLYLNGNICRDIQPPVWWRCVRKIYLPHTAWLDFHSKTMWGKSISVSSSASTCKLSWQISTGQDKRRWKWNLELSATPTLVPHGQRAPRHWTTPRINPSKHGNSWNNHCLGDSSVLWNGNYFKAHSVLPSFAVDSGHQSRAFLSELYTVFFFCSLLVYVCDVQVSKCSSLWIPSQQL